MHVEILSINSSKSISPNPLEASNKDLIATPTCLAALLKIF